MTRTFVVAVAVLVAAGCSREAAPAADQRHAAPSAPSIAGKAPRGAIVTLTPSPVREMPLPDGPAIMDQYAKQFVPDLLIVRVGQQVEFRNSEDSPHNVNVNRIPTGAQVFSVATAPYQKYVHTFTQPGQYAVACDIHPGMLATVVATVTPHVVIAGDNGAFTFSDIAPGQYTMGWIIGGEAGEKRVEISTDRTELSVP